MEHFQTFSKSQNLFFFANAYHSQFECHQECTVYVIEVPNCRNTKNTRQTSLAFYMHQYTTNWVLGELCREACRVPSSRQAQQVSKPFDKSAKL
jgi:hypothetical protein